MLLPWNRVFRGTENEQGWAPYHLYKLWIVLVLGVDVQKIASFFKKLYLLREAYYVFLHSQMRNLCMQSSCLGVIAYINVLQILVHKLFPTSPGCIRKYGSMPLNYHYGKSLTLIFFLSKDAIEKKKEEDSQKVVQMDETESIYVAFPIFPKIIVIAMPTNLNLRCHRRAIAPAWYAC